MISLNVCLLDDTSVKFDVEGKWKGQELHDLVYKHLNLSEREYFGIQFYDKHDQLCWLDPLRSLNKQVKDPAKTLFRFGVKFYAADPVQLQEELTRYLFALQVRKDLLNERLVCNKKTACLLASYYVQGELGNWDPVSHPPGYLRESQFFPEQTDEDEALIMDFHKQHKGESPADVDRNILDVARRLDTYGITLYPCKAEDSAPLNISVAHMGVVVFQDKDRVNTFSWANIRKLSFHRRKFLIKLHPELNEQDTLEFMMESRDKAKSFWKLTAATHTFFRQYQQKSVNKPKSKIFGRGSKYRHSGRTQREVMENSHDKNFRNDSTFNRSQSLRLPSSNDNSLSSLRSSPRPLIGYGNVETRIIEADYPIESSLASMGSNDESGHLYLPERHISTEQSQEELNIDHLHNRMSPNETFLQAGSENAHCATVNGEHEIASGESKSLLNGEHEASVNELNVTTLTSTVASDSENDELSQDLFSEGSSISSLSSPLSTYRSADSLDTKIPIGTAYHVAREILQTERTYVKDLEVITIAFRNAVFEKEAFPDDVKELLFSNFDPLYDYHCLFLGQLQQKLTQWEIDESNDCHKIGDIMLSCISQMKNFIGIVRNHEKVLLALYKTTKSSPEFKKLYKEFELQPVCYLSLNAFILKPSQRLIYYKFIMEKLVQFYTTGHADYQDSKVSLETIIEILEELEQSTKVLENYQRLIELERDLIGLDNLVQGERKFVREGCLQKISRSGSQPRMFFLFSDVLIFTSRGGNATNQFKVHGKFQLQSVKIEKGDDMHGLFCFNLITEDKTYIVAATTLNERAKWMEDLNVTIMKAKNNSLPIIDEVVVSITDPEDGDNEEKKNKTTSLDKRHACSRTMSTRRVCWHRNTSVSTVEYSIAVRNQLSGQLQRKYKSGDKWQKLFVVLTNFCLFFYKTHEDEQPLASLPLIGYAVTKPDENDKIMKELVIKLQYKTHVYFFRADSEFSYFRWMEVMCSATQNSSRTRLFSRQTSILP
ncbi:FERM, ARHGEF and pleckstrin domain-containing protein 2-like [Xenia sp. Carnegie-2017]|uniref:FERM, ARHGEF and pleckstrin domain-containing protein 2-like n=1 Tax=Xenia sp. Carnegie-2017 TaxID=2897299 RepID=UPI001F036E7E|nr:FERM, ARHGEF and pleckstrin domain-containing protein 2-like [Xenia sp. Carnegie-2017]